ncbi:hypothetical protein DRH13_02465 [Candidatus Woesebacteria bacterium]|nr:MAG: hypothetical protein DRH13_02465 [Candidatus Woesebacteria bacterium]
MVAISPPLFLADPQIQPFCRDSRVDLLAPNVEVISANQFVVYRNRTKKGQVEVIKSISPYAMERTDVGTPQEAFRMIPPNEGDGYFSYTPLINNQPPVILDINYNSPRVAAGPLNNNDRIERAGISFLVEEPWRASQNMQHPLFSFPVTSKAELVVTFSILPPADIAPIPNPFAIGAGAIKRVDFAGVVIAGVVMPQHLYDTLLKQTEAANLI